MTIWSENFSNILNRPSVPALTYIPPYSFPTIIVFRLIAKIRLLNGKYFWQCGVRELGNRFDVGLSNRTNIVRKLWKTIMGGTIRVSALEIRKFYAERNYNEKIPNFLSTIRFYGKDINLNGFTYLINSNIIIRGELPTWLNCVEKKKKGHFWNLYETRLWHIPRYPTRIFRTST